MLENNDSSLNTGARDELRLRVLRALEVNPELSQRQLAAELGVSLGGVNYALKALVERGFVKADNFRKSGNKVAPSLMAPLPKIPLGPTDQTLPSTKTGPYKIT